MDNEHAEGAPKIWDRRESQGTVGRGGGSGTVRLFERFLNAALGIVHFLYAPLYPVVRGTLQVDNLEVGNRGLPGIHLVALFNQGLGEIVFPTPLIRFDDRIGFPHTVVTRLVLSLAH